MKTFSALFVILVALQVFMVEAYSQKRTVKASPCKLSLPPEATMQSNTTFTNYYFVRIDADNKPIKIDRITGFDYIKDEEVKACVNNQTFKNFAENAYLVVYVTWVHGEGWRPITIRSKDFTKSITVKSQR